MRRRKWPSFHLFSWISQERRSVVREASTAEFAPAQPWLMPNKEDCIFYHSMSYPNGESVDGAWDIRGLFNEYIGHYPISDKTILDVGTASGFLAFEAERVGTQVTALNALHADEFDRLHFQDSIYHSDRAAHVFQTEARFTKLKAGFWYSWHRYQSGVEMVYAPLTRLPYWKRQFDVVIAGAIIEHLADPVSVISNLAGLAKEAVIIAFTHVIDSDSQFMETANDWSNPMYNYTFWTLSRGLYKRVFANVGFSVEFATAKARIGGVEYTSEFATAKARTGGVEYTRPTIIARRNPT